MPLAITYSEMSQYAKDHYLATSLDALTDFVELVSGLDDVYLTFKADQAKSKAESSKPKGRS